MSLHSKIASALTPKQLTPTEQFMSSLVDASVNRQVIQESVSRSAISLEGYDQSQAAGIDQAIANFRTTVRSAFASVPMLFDGDTAAKGNLSVAQEGAAIIAGLISGAPKSYLSSKRYNEQALAPYAGTKDGVVTTIMGQNSAFPVEGALEDRVSMENYDDRNNNNVVGYSIAYNLQASRQGEFGEAFYPTVIVAPDQVGYNVQVRLLYAYNELQRSTNGSLDSAKLNRRNLIHAIVDATILAADQTKLIPVYRLTAPPASTDNSTLFVSGITPTVLTVDNQPLTTAPLAVSSKSFSLLGICQTNAQLAQGSEDQSDAIDSSVRLSKVYISVTATVGGNPVTEYFGIDVSQFPSSDFNAAPQGNTRKLQLNFDSNAILITPSMLTVAGAAPTTLAGLSTNTARVRFIMTGAIDQTTADTFVQSVSAGVVAVNTNGGQALDMTSGAGQTAVNALSSMTIVGYDLIAFRTNSNRRSRGALIDVQHINYLYTVPLLPPITALRPVTASDSMDGNSLSDLVTATRTQTANRAITALLQAKSFLKAQANSPDSAANQPVLFGASSNLVYPAYLEQTIDVSQAIDSLKDQDRVTDLQALLINTIRDMAITLWVSSEYGPAAEAMYEGQPPKPVIIIGTDPYIARYLQLQGDTRLVGEQFDYKIVQSYDTRMAGQLIFSFGQESSFNSGVPNPLHFGNMAWRPELTLMMPMVRNGAQSMELTVSPSYRHVNNLPVMGVLNVQNISAVLKAKVAVNMHTV